MLTQEEMLATVIQNLKDNILQLDTFYQNLRSIPAAAGMMRALDAEEETQCVKIDEYLRNLLAWSKAPFKAAAACLLAAQNRFEAVISRLAHPKVISEKNMTAVMVATLWGDEKVASAMLLCRDVNINAKTPRGDTVWSIAVQHKRTVVIDKILNPTLGPCINREHLIAKKLFRFSTLPHGEDHLRTVNMKPLKSCLKHK